jgi:hypothetical protein
MIYLLTRAAVYASHPHPFLPAEFNIRLFPPAYIHASRWLRLVCASGATQNRFEIQISLSLSVQGARRKTSTKAAATLRARYVYFENKHARALTYSMINIIFFCGPQGYFSFIFCRRAPVPAVPHKTTQRRRMLAYLRAGNLLGVCGGRDA